MCDEYQLTLKSAKDPEAHPIPTDRNARGLMLLARANHVDEKGKWKK